MRRPDLSIAGWLGLGFAAAAGLLAGMVILALLLQKGIGEEAGRQLELIGPRSTAAARLESSVLYLGVSARAFALAPDAEHRRTLHYATARLDRALDVFVRLPKDRDGSLLAGEVLAAVPAFQAAASALVEAGDRLRGAPLRHSELAEREAAVTAARDVVLQRLATYQELQDRKDAAASKAILSHRQSTNRLLVAAFVVVLALLGATALVVTSEVRRPARRLLDAARRLAHGDYAAGTALADGAPADGAAPRSELAELSGAFASMAAMLRDREERTAAQNEELQVQQEELQSQNEELQAQQEELQAQNEELQRQSEILRDRDRRMAELNAELRSADRRKDEFLAVLAHELRNPLAPIVNALHVIELGESGSEDVRRAHRIATRQVNHLSRLVDDLLDVARITRGKINLRRARVELGHVVQQAAEDHGSLLTGRGIQLTVSAPDGPLWVDADPARIAQVVGNLVQNAAKFGNPGGTVRVVVEAGPPGRARLQVRDDGVGMSAEVVGRLFEPFMQAEASLARTRGGLGLGLALVKGLVELHGGSIHASSDGEGRGSEFTVELPLAAARPEPGARGGAPRADGSPRDGAPRDGLQALAPHPARRVLIIEDNVDSAETLRELLQLSGHEAEVAFDCRHGLEKARAMRPDVILCDLGLPDVDGYELGRRIRAEPALTSALLVALSGYARPEDLARSEAAGFDAHLAKPADIDAIEALLAKPPAPPPAPPSPIDA